MDVSKSFYDFLRLLYVFLEPLFSIWAWFIDQGYLLGCSLTQGFKVRIAKLARNKRVKSSDLKCGRFLGEGCSGIIYEATWSRGRNISLLARKAFPAVPADVFEYEAARLVKLHHPNVVKVLGWTVDRRSCSLVMDHMKYDLFSVVQKRKEAMRNGAKVNFSSTVPIPLREAVHIMLQIAEGMKYVHDQRLAHGDLKPNNVLVGTESDLMFVTVRVTDFGLTETKKRSTTLASHQARCLQILKWKAPELFEDLLGSSTEDSENMWREMFPDFEVVKTSHASSSGTMGRSEMQLADVYSFALTCSYILGAQVPHDSNPGLFEIRNKISSGARPELPSECPEMLAYLISKCWDPIPRCRTDFIHICEEMRTIELELKRYEDWFSASKADWGHFFFDFKESGLEIKGEIGESGQSVVYEGEWKRDDGKSHSVAFEVFKSLSFRISDKLMHLFNSKGTEANLRTSRVLRPFGGTLLKNGRLALVYERCWGDLRRLIDLQMQQNKDTKMPPFKEEVAKDIMLQIAEGMVELHESGIVHGDLKSSNVLVHDLEKFSTRGNHGLKVSCALTGFEYEDWKNEIWLPKNMDVYSYGMTCYEILTGERPSEVEPRIRPRWNYFRKKQELPSEVEPRIRPRWNYFRKKQELQASVHPQLRDLVERCWDANPLKRTTFQEVVVLLKNIPTSGK